jgi:2-haloacid dehalogenase
VSAGTGTQQWVTFDCFGTLVDWEAGFAAMLAPIAGDRTLDVLRAYYSHEQNVEREQPHRSYSDVLVTALGRAAAENGLALSAREARVLPHSWASMPLFDDVEWMLAELRARGYRLGVLTNCDDDLFEITHRQFRVPFDLHLTAERVRGYKPAPWHFRGFERITRASRDNWVHVACSWYHDIAPARALGVKRVWLDREQTRKRPGESSIHAHTAAEAVTAVERLLQAVEVPC